MAGLGSFLAKFVEIDAQSNVGQAPVGRLRLWSNSIDNNNLYSTDEANNQAQITDGGAVATGNAQYIWDWFYNGTLSIIPDFSVVRLISGGGDDGKIALSDNDEINEDSFLGITYGGDISVSGQGKVIYNGKVPGAVSGLGLSSNTNIYMDTVPGKFTHISPDLTTQTIFKLGFTRGDDLYIRPRLISAI